MVAQHIDPDRLESLGPAENLLTTLTTFTDHVVHNRPGMVTPARTNIGLKWEPVEWKRDKDSGDKIVYRVKRTKVGKKTKTVRTRIGVMAEDGKISEAGQIVGEFRESGIFPEVAVWVYRQVAEVWKLDNALAAHWASWAFKRDHRDMKVVLAAFMLVQSRSGEPVRDEGKIVFHDEDYRAVGEAMCLIRAKDDINPKLLIRIEDILVLPEIAQINREMGFGRSARNPALGRYEKVVTKWLQHREDNPRMMAGLIKAGFRKHVRELAQRVHYKPQSVKFFEMLRWRQEQSKAGHRAFLGVDVGEAESWANLSEADICRLIVKTKPNYKRIVGLLPAKVGVTRAIMAAAVEANSVSNADLIILTTTLEDLGLLKGDNPVFTRWKTATEKATNQRAANIAKNVQSREALEGLANAEDNAVKAAFEEVVRGLVVYVVVDKSGTMQNAIIRAKAYLARFLQGFPLESLHVSIFNGLGQEVTIRIASRVGVENAFLGHRAGGITSYAEGFRAIAHYQPKADEDALVIFVGDEKDGGVDRLVRVVQQSGINPVAFSIMEVHESCDNDTGECIPGCNNRHHYQGSVVKDAARVLGIPCFKIEGDMFEGDDAYAIPRILRALIASTPVQAEGRRAHRKTLVEEILLTPLLTKPLWAA